MARLDEKLALELDLAGAALEGLAVQLCLDPVVFDRHAGPLQQFDQIRQIMGEVANILRRRNGGGAVGGIRLEAMKERVADG